MKMKKLLAVLLAICMVCSFLVFPAAADEEGYYVFLAYGGDKEAAGDWGWGYTGADVEGITATTAYAKEGDTVTIGLTFETPVVYTWYMAPCIIAEGVSAVDYTIDSVTMDGKEVTPDLTLGDEAWWYEGTGDYTKDECIRLAGGYNEWATQYVASPVEVSEILYTITLNSVTTGSAASGEPTWYEGSMHAFIAIGADSEEGSWDMQYYGEGNEGNTAKAAVEADLVNGESATISVEFETPVKQTWFWAPCVVVEDAAAIDVSTTFDVSVKIDGVEVEFDADAGENWWIEGTGDYGKEVCLRTMGGYNEWGTQYMTAPAGFTSLEVTLTPHVYEAAAVAFGESTEEYYAFVVYGGEEDWSASYDGETASAGITATTATAKSGEQFTIALNFENPVGYVWYAAPVLAVNDPALLDASTTFEIEVYIDGELVAYDEAAGDNWWAEGSGAYANAIRLAGGYNEWGSQYVAQDQLQGMTELKYVITPHIFCGAPAEEVDVPFDTTQTYHAYLGIQTPTWIFRNCFDGCAGYGMDDETVDFSTLGFVDGGWVAQGGTFTDTEIYGDGVYSVKLEGYDFSGNFQDAPILGADGLFNQIFVSTDMPVSQHVTISDVTLIMDGKTIYTFSEAFINDEHPDSISMMLINIWNNDLPEMPFYFAPSDSVEVQFTVSGFGFDKA